MQHSHVPTHSKAIVQLAETMLVYCLYCRYMYLYLYRLMLLFWDAGSPGAHMVWTCSSLKFDCITEAALEAFRLSYTLVYNNIGIVSRLLKPVPFASQCSLKVTWASCDLFAS